MNTTVAFLGYGGIAPGCLREIIKDDDFQLSTVFTHPRRSRTRNDHQSELVKLAGEYGLVVDETGDVSVMRERLKQLIPDLVISVGYLTIIPADVLHLPRLGSINIHGGLLPKYRGRAPISWALLNGEKTIGITVHYMTEEVDSGDIILQHRMNVSVQDTAATLYEKMKKISPGILVGAMKRFSFGPPKGVPQDEMVATRYGRLNEDVCRIRWEEPAVKVHDRIRALVKPYPGAFTYHRGRKYFIWKSMPAEKKRENSRPGLVLERDKRGVIVGTGEGTVLIEEVQEECGTASAPEWPVGDVLTERSGNDC